MDNLMERWFEAAAHRRSVREYSRSVDKELFSELKDLAADLSNDEARLVLLSKGNVLKAPLFTGGITGTKCFAAVIAKKNCKYMAGYIGEAFVLECTAMGLGTCWLGGSYKKSLAKQFINLAAGESLVCIIAVGECSDNAVQSTTKHKGLDKLVWMQQDEFKSVPDWQKAAVRCARLAPSALNKLPWIVDFEGNNIIIEPTSNNFGFGWIDCGIAMLHIELGAAHNGVYGDWEAESGVQKFIPNNL